MTISHDLSTPHGRLDAALATFGPLRHRLEDFRPADTIPWEAQAQQLLRCALGSGFIGLRPPARVDREVEALREHLALTEGSTLLDLGCGPGMYGNRLGARGVRVTGIDIAGPVVDHAQGEATARRLPCTYRRGSFLTMSFETRFDAALLVNSTVNHLTRSELGTLLQRVHGALHPGGRFALEVALEPEGFADGRTVEKRKLYSLPHSPWSDVPHEWLERHLCFPEVGQRVTHHLIVPRDGPVQEYWSRFQLFRRAWLTEVLDEHGFEVEAWFDPDFHSAPSPEDERVWLLVRARSTGR